MLHKSKVLSLIGIDFLTAVGFFIIVMFLPTYFVTYFHISLDRAFSINTCNMCIFALSILLGGYLSDIYGRKKMLLYPCIAFVIFSYPLFHIFPLNIFLVHMILVVFMGFFFGIIPAVFCEIFPTEVRFSGVSFSHNISMTLFGGSAPYLTTKLIQKTGNIETPALLLMIAGLLSFIAVSFINERSQKPLNF